MMTIDGTYGMTIDRVPGWASEASAIAIAQRTARMCGIEVTLTERAADWQAVRFIGQASPRGWVRYEGARA